MSQPTATQATCTHGDASAIETVACGTTQAWICESDCGREFSIIKPHHVFKFTTHAPACDRKHLPAGWCGCEAVKSAGCVDCDREFPRDVTDGEGVLVFN